MAVDSEDSGNGVTSTKTKILAYLGELKPGDYVSAKKLCYDLALRFTTAKNCLTTLEDRGLVDKMITNNKGTVALFRIDPNAGKIKDFVVTQKTETGTSVMTTERRLIPYVPPEWSDAYGKHPSSV